MADVNVGTGAIPPAGTLTGTEIIGILQSANARELTVDRFPFWNGTEYLLNQANPIIRMNAGGPGLSVPSGGRLCIYTNAVANSVRMAFASDGRVSVYGSRSNSPSADAPGSGNFRVSAGAAGGYALGTYDTQDYIAAQFVRDVGGVATEEGKITISTSGTVYGTTSDYRVKFNIRDLSEEEAIASVMARRPRAYERKDNPGIELRGYIAHEMQAVKPQAVHGEKDAVEEIGTAVLPVRDEAGRVIIGQSVEIVGITEAEAPSGSEWTKTGERDVLQSVDMGQAGDPDIVRALQAALRRIAALEKALAEK